MRRKGRVSERKRADGTIWRAIHNGFGNSSKNEMAIMEDERMTKQILEEYQKKEVNKELKNKLEKIMIMEKK